jgi:purine-binding chemotaxis protein CheW
MAITTSSTQDLNASDAQGMGSSKQFATFYIGDLYFGIDVLNVQEVLRHQEMTPVPLAPGVIQGLINLRGQIVTAVDMRRRLDLPAHDDSETSMNMVVRTQEGAVSLLVDEIGDVLEADRSSFESPPDNLSPAARELIRGIYKLKDRLLLVLDTERAVDAGQAY